MVEDQDQEHRSLVNKTVETVQRPSATVWQARTALPRFEVGSWERASNAPVNIRPYPFVSLAEPDNLPTFISWRFAWIISDSRNVCERVADQIPCTHPNVPNDEDKLLCGLIWICVTMLLARSPQCSSAARGAWSGDRGLLAAAKPGMAGDPVCKPTLLTQAQGLP